MQTNYDFTPDCGATESEISRNLLSGSNQMCNFFFSQTKVSVHFPASPLITGHILQHYIFFKTVVSFFFHNKHSLQNKIITPVLFLRPDCGITKSVSLG